MNRSYTTILSFTLRHNYYTSGFTTDFAIMPTAATKRLFKKRRLLFKSTGYGFSLCCDNLTMATVTDTLSEVRLNFILKLKNTSFMNVTDLPPRSGNKDICYLYGEGNTGDMTMEILPLYPPVFTYKFPPTMNIDTQLQVEDPDGNIIIDETFPNNASEELSASINVIGRTPGLYRFIVEDQPDETIYITGESPGNGIFGLAEITLPENFDPQSSGAMEYEFLFEPRSSIWEYHISFSRDYSGYDFAFNDMEGGEKFEQLENPPPDYGEGGATVFVSPEIVAYQEAPRTGLELSISNGSSRTIENLPAPAVNNPESKVYITI